MLHEKCEQQAPLNMRAGKCETAGCGRNTTSKTFRLCPICSAETGNCESCGKPLVEDEAPVPAARSRRRPAGLAAGPQAMTGIAPGGCMGGNLQARAKASKFYSSLPGFERIDFSSPEEWVVYFGAPVQTELPKVFWGHKIRYVFPTSNGTPTVAAWVTVLVSADTKIGRKQALIARIQGLAGVIKVEPLFPDDQDEVLARFYAVSLKDKASADEVVADLSELKSVERVTHSSGRTAFNK
jgi:hypothetical protein